MPANFTFRLALGTTLLTGISSVGLAQPAAPRGAADPSPAADVAEAQDAGLAASPSEPEVPPRAAPKVRLPFASKLAERPSISGPTGWTVIAREDAWSAIARSNPKNRQDMRWRLAISLIGQNRPHDALGVLEVMGQDDPDLELVANYRLAKGAALAAMGLGADADFALSLPALVENPEACAWRIVALGESDKTEDVLRQLSCAKEAIDARKAPAKRPFLYALARAALDTGQYDNALSFLQAAGDADTLANLLRGKAYLASGDMQKGRLALKRVVRSGTAEQQADARLSLLEMDIAAGKTDARALLVRLDKLLYTWRGGPIEKRALRAKYDLATKDGDDAAALASGATLFRYFKLGDDTAPLLEKLRVHLGRVVSEENRLPLADAAGLFWEYRDLAPPAAGGDVLVTKLANRLERARLYAKAAELLNYQLKARISDLGQGPLSVRVARLYILAGDPGSALSAVRESNGMVYPDEMQWDRDRIEAIALFHKGEPEEALALLEDVPGSNALSAEMRWSLSDWAGLAADESLLPARGEPLAATDQAMVLRYAVALAMLGREIALANLRQRYASAFAGKPGEDAFDLLTAPVKEFDVTRMDKAMEQIPSQSAAGPLGDLLYINKS